MNLKNTVEAAWEKRELLKETHVQEAIHEVVGQLDRGVLRVAQKENGIWKVNDWVKKAVILYFPIRKMESIEIPPFEFHD
jgi:2,3,4,5-tetrahydropyridine-2-carboxylate N-succinyltransferase